MMTNREIAEMFERVADMMAIRGDIVHRLLAYRRAGESIRELGRNLSDIQAEGGLTEIPGIGKTLAEKIEEMLTTGRLNFYERLAEEIPPTLVDMLRIEGVGPKRVKQIYETLGITTIEELAEAARTGKLSDLPGLGKKTEANLVANIEALMRHGDERKPLGEVYPIAMQILNELRELPGVLKAEAAGSLRRRRETIGDLDLLVAATEAEPIMRWFREMPSVESISGSGPTKTRVTLVNGLGVDLRVLPPARWGTLLQYFSGSQAHNVQLRELALKQGLSLSENSFKVVESGEEILCAEEEEVYGRLGLPYIIPTLREAQGEIEAARTGKLPQVVQLSDIQLDLHMHTTWSDGKQSIRAMAEAARERGLTGIVITDHSQSLGIANGLTIERLREQASEVRVVNEAMGPDFTIWHGTEMEIKADGTLDYPDEVLAELDFVIASLHVGLKQPKEQVTARALAAIENPHVDMIGHLTGRLLPDRPPADLDLEAVFAAAARTGTILEVNANPLRLDLKDSHIKRALAVGVKIAINTDAHNVGQLDLMHYGVATAQRGWATAADVINTGTMAALKAYLDGRG
ncbi:MAG: DNA polymerase/3'-5' exonuclease PolX [Anaerolineales bacterium]|nr:DNA polymerase/3'-5' exonuclease PolX [Anaerolineales bacterium]